MPKVVARINNAFQRADQMMVQEGRNDMYWYAPIVADAEAGRCACKQLAPAPGPRPSL